jgi:hypothetical protein
MYVSCTLPNELHAVIQKCFEFYLTFSTTAEPETEELSNSSEARKTHLKEWLGPWNRGNGKAFPMCLLASILWDTSTFCPVAIGLDDMKVSIFGGWRQAAGSNNQELLESNNHSIRTEQVKL